MSSKPQTLFDKLWASHRIGSAGDGADLIAIDRILLHERTGGVALKMLAETGHAVHAPSRVFAIMDHIVSYRSDRAADDARSPGGEVFIRETRNMAQYAGIHLIDSNDSRQGIVHVIAPELGIAIPGASLVCPDSHTCSLGALGALAWGIGSSEAEHAMATGALRVNQPPQMRITIHGELPEGTGAKDLALHIIARHGASGGKRCAVEFAGSAVENLSVEERLTLCNLAVEFSAFTAIIRPDDKVFEYVKGRPFSPTQEHSHRAAKQWMALETDEHAEFDYELSIDASKVNPLVSWGTSPAQSSAINTPIPQNADSRALAYMGLEPGAHLAGLRIDGAFIGSCTNGRLSDLRSAAKILAGRKVASHVLAICVPGSQLVKRQAEAEGLDIIFKSAGFEWGAPGCAMCFYAGGVTFPPEARVISSTNRNFEGRQGPCVRTHLASPATVAASAVAGMISQSGSVMAEIDA